MGNRRLAIASTVVFASLLACDMPAMPFGAAATATTEALSADLSTSTSSAAIPVTGNTATPSGPWVSVSANTNCRSGPGSSYSLVFTADPGVSFLVVGRSASSKYWLINDPSGGTCWLWNEYATVTGDTSGLPQYTAPLASVSATRTPKPAASATASPSGQPIFPILTLIVPIVPAAPGNLGASRTCAGGFSGFTPIWIEDVTLSWTASAKATGYRVYKDGTLAATLSAGTTGYHTQLRSNEGTGNTPYNKFAVEAFNDAGVSARPDIDVPLCP